MKTYKIELSNEPLKEGCLTQFGCIESIRALCYYVGFKFKPLDKNELKHLKCFEVSEPLNLNGEDDYNWGRKVEVTDPSELQQIWEAIRGYEPEVTEEPYDIETDPYMQYTIYHNRWKNFTLEPGTYELFGISEQPLQEEDNNGWISVEDRMPNRGESVIIYYLNYYKKGRRIKACYIPRFFEECDEDIDDLDYDEEKDRYYLPEGWYEEIDNWDCSMVRVTEGKPTHWQPLPKPPNP